jgi:hypothetical protein
MTDTPIVPYEIDILSKHGEVHAHGSEWRNILTVELDEDGACTISVDSKHSSDNGVPFSVWHGRTLRWTNESSQGASAVVDGYALEALRDKIAPLISIVSIGHRTKWDGNNMVGRLTDEAAEASDEIENLVEACAWADDSIGFWDAYAWIADNKRQTIEDLKLTATSTDAEKAAAAETLTKEARSQDVILTNVESCIDALVEELQEDSE